MSIISHYIDLSCREARDRYDICILEKLELEGADRYSTVGTCNTPQDPACKGNLHNGVLNYFNYYIIDVSIISK